MLLRNVAARQTSASARAAAARGRRAKTICSAALQPHQQPKQQPKQQQKQQQPKQQQQHHHPQLIASVAAASAALLLVAAPLAPAPARADALLELPFEKPVITTESSERAVKLTKRLRAAGARLYGAFWCSHCFSQAALFGRQAMAADFPYTECFPDGWSRGGGMAPACEALPVRAFPTWAIGDRIIEGELSFDAIDALLDEASSPGASK